MYHDEAGRPRLGVLLLPSHAAPPSRGSVLPRSGSVCAIARPPVHTRFRPAPGGRDREELDQLRTFFLSDEADPQFDYIKAALGGYGLYYQVS
jgi:hypothetical protein